MVTAVAGVVHIVDALYCIALLVIVIACEQALVYSTIAAAATTSAADAAAADMLTHHCFAHTAATNTSINHYHL
jgi:hypothetical protein